MVLQERTENRDYLLKLHHQFREYPLVLEVRHSSWIVEETLDLLAQGIGICNIDQPVFHRSVKPSSRTTSSVGYVRLHGRNYGNWFSAQADVRGRYDYLYSMQELDPWLDRIREIEHDAQDTYVVTNNHNLGQAVVNAFEISFLLPQQPMNVPASLVEHYPEADKDRSVRRTLPFPGLGLEQAQLDRRPLFLKPRQSIACLAIHRGRRNGHEFFVSLRRSHQTYGISRSLSTGRASLAATTPSCLSADLSSSNNASLSTARCAVALAE